MTTGLAQHTVWAGFVFEIYEMGSGLEAPFIWIIRDYQNAPKLFDGRALTFKHAVHDIFDCLADYLSRTAQGFSVLVSEGERPLDAKDAGVLIRTGLVSAKRCNGHLQLDTRREGQSH